MSETPTPEQLGNALDQAIAALRAESDAGRVDVDGFDLLTQHRDAMAAGPTIIRQMDAWIKKGSAFRDAPTDST
jgi:hypothetical protein